MENWWRAVWSWLAPKAASAPPQEVDRHCTVRASTRVFVEGEIVYAATLRQTEGSHDKFYVLQLLQSTQTPAACYVWQRWGRAGAVGQGKLNGPCTLATARAEFSAKFTAKTGNIFRGGAGHGFIPHPGMYALGPLGTDVAPKRKAAATTDAPSRKRRATGTSPADTAGDDADSEIDASDDVDADPAADDDDDDSDFSYVENLPRAEREAAIVRTLEPVRDQLPLLLRQAIALSIDETDQAPLPLLALDALPLGGSRVGGLPDLPAAVPWPTYQGRPLALVVQINLSDVAAAAPLDGASVGTDDTPLLPPHGWFWLFLDLDDSTYWTECDGGGGVAFRFWDGPTEQLARRRNPTDPVSDPIKAGTVLSAAPLAMSRITTMQCPDEAQDDRYDAVFTKREQGAIRALVDHGADDLRAIMPAFPAAIGWGPLGFSMLGYPVYIQEPFLRFDDVLLLQVSELNVRYYPSKAARQAQSSLYIGSDWKSGMFSVTLAREDLRAGRFDKVAFYYDC